MPEGKILTVNFATLVELYNSLDSAEGKISMAEFLANIGDYITDRNGKPVTIKDFYVAKN